MMKNKKKEDNEIVSGMGGGTWEGEMAIQELFLEFENNKERNNNAITVIIYYTCHDDRGYGPRSFNR